MLLLVLALVLPLALMAVLGKPYITQLKRLAFGQYIREDGPQSHLQKQGTPTAGGVLLMAVWVLVLALIYAINPYVGQPLPLSWPVLAVLLGVGGILFSLGFSDDALKILKKQNKGLGGYAKLALQAGAGLLLGVVSLTLFNHDGVNCFGTTVHLSWGYLLYSVFAVMATSNAVNLTDGLDGLASGALITSFLGLALLLGAGLAGLMPLVLPLPVACSLLVVCLATLSVLFGFLLFNHNPAQVFMGDSGSLTLGGVLATVTLLAQQDAWLLLLGLLYVAEAVSVILQVLWFKRTGKRLFKMAPLHHHFELCGWKETTVVRVLVGVNALAVGLAIILQLA
jgi:phospho-N-acetylmuramoyl-pentapeptide-transferase